VKSSEEVNARDKNKTEKMGKDGKEEKKDIPASCTETWYNVICQNYVQLSGGSLSLSLSLYTEELE
jgi:hypothetical protein